MNKLKMTNETKEKLRIAHLGKHHSQETREKIRAALKKRITPEIHKQLSTQLKKYRPLAHHFASTNLAEKEILRNKYLIKKPWDGKIRTFENYIKNHYLYKIWRNSVIERDKKCAICGTISFLEVHHKKKLYEIIKENLNKLINYDYDIPELWDITNGEVYCKNCHSLFHTNHNKRIFISKKNSLIKLLESVVSWDNANGEKLPIEIKNKILEFIPITRTD